jgi:hypothetical protein
VDEHEAEVLEEEREGVDFAVECFGHRDDCTSWGKSLILHRNCLVLKIGENCPSRNSVYSMRLVKFEGLWQMNRG